MDFKKCSEVYGYKSIAEVEEEEMAEKLAQRDWVWIDAMIANDIPIEKIVIISGRSKEEILSRKGRQKHEKNMVKDTDK